jgi:hypothetical protein
VDTSSIITNQRVALSSDIATWNAEARSHEEKWDNFWARYNAHRDIRDYHDDTIDLEDMPADFWAEGTSLDAEKRALQLERIRLHEKRDKLNERQQNVRGMVALREIKENAEETMKSVRSRLED